MKGRLRVVVVDDFPAIRKLINLELEDGPIDVVGEGENGRDAISLVEETHPDLVLMDIDMPIMNGIDATREIRERFPEVVVFGFTGSSDGNVEAMLRAGATIVLGKPELERLLQDLTSWVEDSEKLMGSLGGHDRPERSPDDP